jgi:hypothetical protein
MKSPSLKTVFRVIGVVLPLFACLFLFLSRGFALAAKGDSIRTTVGIGLPLFGVSLLALSVFVLAGAATPDRAIPDQAVARPATWAAEGARQLKSVLGAPDDSRCPEKARLLFLPHH